MYSDEEDNIPTAKMSHEDTLATLIAKLRSTVKKLIVSVDEDTITLEGSCQWYYHKQLAQHEAMRLFPGKRLNANKVVVIVRSEKKS